MPISGCDGTVKVGATDVAEVTKWSFEPSASVPKYASNSTSKTKKGVPGTKDSKGTIEVKYDEVGGAPWGVGDVVTLELLADKNTVADSITVDAIIATSPIECDIDGGEIVGVVYSFEGSGPWVGIGKWANI